MLRDQSAIFVFGVDILFMEEPGKFSFIRNINITKLKAARDRHYIKKDSPDYNLAHYNLTKLNNILSMHVVNMY